MIGWLLLAAVIGFAAVVLIRTLRFRPEETVPAESTPVSLNEEKVLAWLNEGAQPTDTVKSILSKEGILAKYAASKVKKN